MYSIYIAKKNGFSIPRSRNQPNPNCRPLQKCAGTTSWSHGAGVVGMGRARAALDEFSGDEDEVGGGEEGDGQAAEG